MGQGDLPPQLDQTPTQSAEDREHEIVLERLRTYLADGEKHGDVKNLGEFRRWLKKEIDGSQRSDGEKQQRLQRHLAPLESLPDETSIFDAVGSIARKDHSI